MSLSKIVALTLSSNQMNSKSTELNLTDHLSSGPSLLVTL